MSNSFILTVGKFLSPWNRLQCILKKSYVLIGLIYFSSCCLAVPPKKNTTIKHSQVKKINYHKPIVLKKKNIKIVHKQPKNQSKKILQKRVTAKKISVFKMRSQANRHISDKTRPTKKLVREPLKKARPMITLTTSERHGHATSVRQVPATNARHVLTTSLSRTLLQGAEHGLKMVDHPLVEFVHKMVNTLSYSAYKLGGTYFNSSRGIYILDCSSYVDRILKTIYPQAFSKLVHFSKSTNPTTHDYYHFFTKLKAAPQHYWDPIKSVKKLRPGDIVVFRNIRKKPSTGHIMIVMDKPIANKDMLLLRIADSAPFRHSHDTRLRNVSGIGIGTMLLQVNPETHQPSAYAWTVGSRWKRNVVFAMARPLEIRA